MTLRRNAILSTVNSKFGLRIADRTALPGENNPQISPLTKIATLKIIQKLRFKSLVLGMKNIHAAIMQATSSNETICTGATPPEKAPITRGIKNEEYG
ncbi:hypothetical protein PKF022_03550 [Polynucleobacter sp. KF022]|nr:hypothetical protein PKF022_03550 [Polynucleobacter sp. KF022]